MRSTSRIPAPYALAGPQKITAPMPGKIVRVILAEKDGVKAGQGVIVMEAMKMQNEMKSPKDGKVQKILASEGSAVNAGDALAIIESPSTAWLPAVSHRQSPARPNPPPFITLQ